HADVANDIEAWRTARLTKAPPKIAMSAYRQALRGETVTGIEVVEGVKAAKGYGIKVYDLPIEALWKAVIDEPHFAGRLPVSVSRVVKGDARTHDHVLYQYLEVPIISDRWWMTHMYFNGDLYRSSGGRAWELSWSDSTHDPGLRAQLDPSLFDEGEPVAWTTGAWLLVRLDDDRTLAEYHVWTDPGGSIPVGPATRFASGEVEDTLESMGTLAREHIPNCRGRFRRVDNEPM
ncbi:MAG: hypothetical protein QGG40_18740, partial [Myxococcota bacterium]|nr:hypothetical protein [Myxococcota bacterium]